MTTRSTSPIYAVLATTALAAMLFVAPIDNAEAGKKSGAGARDHRGSVGKLQCQGHCADRHVRDQVAPRGKNIAGTNPIIAVAGRSVRTQILIVIENAAAGRGIASGLPARAITAIIREF